MGCIVNASHRARLLALGNCPPWWRPLKRRAWRRRMHAILTEAISEAAAQIAARYWDAMTVPERLRHEEMN